MRSTLAPAKPRAANSRQAARKTHSREPPSAPRLRLRFITNWLVNLRREQPGCQVGGGHLHRAPDNKPPVLTAIMPAGAGSVHDCVMSSLWSTPEMVCGFVQSPPNDTLLRF